MAIWLCSTARIPPAIHPPKHQESGVFWLAPRMPRSDRIPKSGCFVATATSRHQDEENLRSLRKRLALFFTLLSAAGGSSRCRCRLCAPHVPQSLLSIIWHFPAQDAHMSPVSPSAGECPASAVPTECQYPLFANSAARLANCYHGTACLRYDLSDVSQSAMGQGAMPEHELERTR